MKNLAKNLAVGLMLATFVLSAASCKKCMTCTASDKTTGDVLATSPEYCDSGKKLDDIEDAFKATWGGNGIQCRVLVIWRTPTFQTDM